MERKTFLFLCLHLLLIITSQVNLNKEKQLLESKGVTTLEDSDFYDKTGISLQSQSLELKEGSDWVVLFYASWCGHCKKFISETYQNIRDNVDRLDFKVIPAAIDCPTNPKVCKDFMIAGYPTVYYFKQGGKKTQFSPKADKSMQNVIEFIKKSHNGEEFKVPQTAVQKTEEPQPENLQPNQVSANIEQKIQTTSNLEAKQGIDEVGRIKSLSDLKKSKIKTKDENGKQIEVFNPFLQRGKQGKLKDQIFSLRQKIEEIAKSNPNLKRQGHNVNGQQVKSKGNHKKEIIIAFFVLIVIGFVGLKYLNPQNKARINDVDAVEEKMFDEEDEINDAIKLKGQGEEKPEKPQKIQPEQAIKFEEFSPNQNRKSEEDQKDESPLKSDPQSSFQDLNDFEDLNTNS